MKKLLGILIMLCVSFTYAQNNTEPKLEKDGDITFVTYYYDNGNVQQKGAFDVNKKLHGQWISYDINGEKTAQGSYKNGKKVGKWFFWSGDNLREVDYVDSKIVNVNEWNNKTKLASNK